MEQASASSKGPLIDPALCRCCRSIKKCRLLNAEYEWRKTKEVYSEIFVDCFGFLLSNLDGQQNERSICATCVRRLREANAFRLQVLQSEQLFLESKLEHKPDVNAELSMDIKTEPEIPDYPGDDIDVDDIPLIELDLKGYISKMKVNDKMNATGTIKTNRQRKTKQKCKDKAESAKRKLKVKLDAMLELPVDKRKRKVTSKPKDRLFGHDGMVYMNAVTILKNSYVCPFHNRISMYYCFYCRDQFTNPAELREHTWTHDPKTIKHTIENRKIPKMDITRIDCRLCPEKIQDLETFKTHIAKAHNLVVYPVGDQFLKFRLTTENLVCTECGKTFPFFDVLKKHMIDHFGTHTCDMCGACFLEHTSLRTHIRTHSKVETDHPCEVCGKNLKSKYSRYLHVRTVHEKKPTVNCYKCEASFLSYALRNRHLIEVHGDNRTFPCKLCDKVYNRRKTLMEHNRRNHRKVFRHQCNLCDQKFYVPCRLKEHMSTHTGERNFQCDSCDKSYPHMHSLQGHMKTHSGEKRHKCDLCSCSFSQPSSLRNHVKTHHQAFDLSNCG